VGTAGCRIDDKEKEKAGGPAESAVTEKPES
jgi:hypothetical protein